MKFDFEEFCEDKSIPMAPLGHKHARPGWVNVECPFCTGNQGYHLGFDKENDYFRCWRCGFQRHTDAVKGLLKCSIGDARQMLHKYGRDSRPTLRETTQSKAEPLTEVKFPVGTDSLKYLHKEYLRSRQFDPDILEAIWNLKGTGPVGKYKFRVIAPVYFEGQIVSYQGRDITDKSSLPYKACEQSNELRDHKHCLYGAQLVGEDSVVVVEGITDVWRLGPGAVATFGIEFTDEQVNLLRAFKNKFIWFDTADPQAITQATKLADQLSVFPGHVELVEVDCDDPAELDQEEADELMEELLSKQVTT